MSTTTEDALVQHDLSLTEGAVFGLLEAATVQAEKLGFRAAVSVVDNSGLLLGFLRMPGAFLVSSELCQRKARCAAGLGLAPETIEDILHGEADRVRDGLLRCEDFTLIRGGLPLYWKGSLVGGIGVSGGSEAQDTACVNAAIKSLNGFHFKPNPA